MDDTVTAPPQDPITSSVDEPIQQEDYFGFSEFHDFYLPDGRSWIKFKAMNEGEKARFQKNTQRDLVVERQSGNARMKLDVGLERHQLIKTCVVGWNLTRQGQPQPFGERSLQDFLDNTNPRIVEDLEKAIRKANPWLLNEMSVEDIDREIESLQEMRAIAAEREEGKSSSSSK
ncbi:MAG TPA: hypothetical protein VIY48_07405 [Candidatus Paceibacterota bacterium]